MLRDAAVPDASVTLQGVTKSFGALKALDDVSLNVPSGALTAVLGPSGCGKSTLLRAIAGFERIDAGRVYLGDRDVTAMPLRDRNIGFVFQNYALFPHLNVERNVAFALDVLKQQRETIRERVRELLDLVQLPGYGKRLPHELSGGQRQRVALARALAARPALLLLDEPFAALDMHVRRDLRTSLRDLHDAVHVTTLLVTHDADEAMEVADNLVLLKAGHVEQTGSPLDLYHDPASPFVMNFLGPANALAIDGAIRYVRPHNVRVRTRPFAGSQAARIARVVELGSRTRLELTVSGDVTVSAEINAPFDGIAGAARGDTVYFSPVDEQSFSAKSRETTS
jgi:sulfate transport system ATP-binding protein